MSADFDRSDSDPPKGSQADRVEALLFECLEAADPDRACQDAAAAHPELATALGDAYRALQQWDLIQPTAGEAAAIARDLEHSMPERLGDHRLLRRLGAGGMGVVFLARDEVLQRTVALKLIRPEHLYMPGARERFQREVETIARLQHPGIVPIYSVGKQAGIPFFTMQHVRGCSLSAALHELHQSRRPPDANALLTLSAELARADDGDDGGRSQDESGSTRTGTGSSTHGIHNASWPDACVLIAIQVASALQHAHERGILHRDVKPSNILLTSDGRAMLVDFGLAFSDQEDQRLTRSTSELGSLPYLPPEHVAGAAPDPSRAADVYSLGVTLCEMLTLRNPFLGRNSEETRRNILEARPLRLRREHRSISWELETVCLKAMDPDPLKRYRTMLEFQRELERVRDRQTIEARRPGLARRSRRWAQRHPTVMATMVVALLSAIGALVLFGIQDRRAFVASERLRESAEVERYVALLSNADVELGVGNRPGASRRLLAECREQDRGFEWRHLEFATDQSIGYTEELPAPVQSVAWSPDGSRYLVACQDGTLGCWTLDGEAVWRVTDQFVSAMTFRVTGDDGHELITALLSGELQVRDAASGEVRHVFAASDARAPSEVADIAATPDGRRLFTAGSDGRIVEWDAEQRRFERELVRHEFRASCVSISPDGTRLASGGFDRKVSVCDTRSGEQITQWQLPNWCLDVAWAPDGHSLFVADGFALRTFDVADPTGRPVTFDGDRSGALAVHCSADGSRVAAVLERRVLYVYRVVTREPLRLEREVQLHGHEGLVQHLRCAPDGRHIVSGSTDQFARLWRTEFSAQSMRASQLKIVSHMALVDHQAVIVADARGGLAECSPTEPVRRLTVAEGGSDAPHGAQVVAILPAGRQLTTVDAAGRVIGWQRDAGGWRAIGVEETGLSVGAAAMASPTATPAEVLAAAASEQLVVGCADGSVHVLGPAPRSWPAHAQRITAMVVRGDALWTAAVDGSVKCWRLRTGELALTGHRHPAWIAAMLMSPDGSWLATSCADTTVRVLDAVTGRELRQLQGHGRVPLALATDEAGSRLISSGGFDRELRFWQPDTGRCLVTLSQPAGVMAVAFDVDDDVLVLGDRVGRVRWLRTRAGGPREFRPRTMAMDSITSPPGGHR